MGSRAAFVAQMNRARAALGLRDTHYANPVGLDDADNYSTAADLAKLAVRPAPQRVLPRETIDLPARRCSGAQKRTFVNRNTLVRRVPWVNGVKTGPHERRPATCSSARRRRDGVTVISVVLGEPSEAARDADSLRSCATASTATTRAPCCAKGAVLGRPELRYRDERVDARRRATVERDRAPRERARRSRQRRPTEVDGPAAAGARVGTAVVRVGGQGRRPRPARHGGPGRRARPRADAPRATAHGPVIVAVLVALLAVCSLLLMLLRRRARGGAGAGGVRRGGRAA